MEYKKKLTIISAITALLAFAYALTIFFEPERTGARTAAFTWLDPRLAVRAESIKISGSGEGVELAKKNGQWFVLHNGKDYPAKKLRVEDLLDLLAAKAAYPLHSSNDSSHGRLGVDEASASRIIVSDSSGPGSGTLLDLLIGQGDQTGQNVYLRKQGENAVRSGEDTFTSYISGPRNSWYNLRLLSEMADIDLDSIQRLTVSFSAAEGQTENRIFTRSNSQWIVSDVAEPDMGKVDGYIRGILNTEGDDFTEPTGGALFNDSITLELGDGSVKTIRLTAADTTRRRSAMVAGSDYVYSLAPWAVERLFREAAYFEKQ